MSALGSTGKKKSRPGSCDGVRRAFWHGPIYAARGRGGDGGGEEKDSERSGRAEGRVVGELGDHGNWK
jgi:hypothetical protein